MGCGELWALNIVALAEQNCHIHPNPYTFLCTPLISGGVAFFVVVLKKLTNNKFTKVLMKVRGLESGREWRLEPDASSLAIL